MHKRALLILIMGTMLSFAASAEQTCAWDGWWHTDIWGNIQFSTNPSGSVDATFDGYGIYAAGTFAGSLSLDKDGLPCKFIGTWVKKERPSVIAGDTESNSGEIELEMSPYDHMITGRYRHTSGDWHNFTSAKPGYLNP